ncbi:GNAT family N-acetyltransferase [Dietzia sp. SLG310A2-38A2]|uniref:GNAT family N-acetyltransferase n=1 Tax=Dietzia sp. SLG310A2-38A2 TaxID=1630643 RepID=UPI0015FE334D|nr:GNAT family N-acetyltransferase [Dietzia sp. SLG310A2-38A2]MBB1032740.1 GNAT family N-acetyltransferase [Dietzia sp. SLG310A2-38A2]
MTLYEDLTVREVGFAEWSRLDFDSPYYTKSYCDISGIVEPDFVAPVCLEFRGDATGIVAHLPLLLRKVPGTPYFDATSPYGYGGLRGDPVSIESFEPAFAQWASRNNVIAAFLRSDPTNGQQYRLAHSASGLVQLGSTVLWPTDDPGSLMSGMKKKHRQYTRKARRSGLTVCARQEVQDLQSFADLYSTSMKRLNASEYYGFGQSYWDALASADDFDLLLVEVAFDGEIVCGLICLVGGETLHAHLLGTSDAGRDMKANYLAYYTAAEWSATNGLANFHLGGGFGGEESDLLEWKAGFCPAAPLADFSVSKMVLNQHAYIEVAGTASTEGYFPPWRS